MTQIVMEKGMRLEKMVAPIAGGVTGIGKATAGLIIEEGVTVLLCKVNKQLGKETAVSLGQRANFHKVDTADREAVQAWLGDVAQTLGRIDIFINIAGIARDIANAYLFLVSDEASYISGQVLRMDGGIVIGR